MPPAPAARKLMEEKGLSAGDVPGSGRRGQILKEDVLAAALKPAAPSSPAEAVTPPPAAAASAPLPVPAMQMRAPSVPNDAAREERVKMTRLRQTIARRLKDAQNTAAMLTTFNDVDMSAIMSLRSQYKDLFEKRHGVKLGFMGFFVKACIQALQEVPAVNGEIDRGRHRLQELLPHRRRRRHRQGPGGAGRARRRPHVAGRDRAGHHRLRRAARDGKLTIDDMTGGTFTISNGGMYGSLNCRRRSSTRRSRASSACTRIKKRAVEYPAGAARSPCGR